MVTKKDTGPSVFQTNKKRSTFWLTVTVSLACVLLFYPLVQGTFDFTTDNGFGPQNEFDHAILSAIPKYMVQASKRHSAQHYYPKNKIRRTQKSCGADLAVFKGREARLNHAIFQILAILGPQTISQLQKQLRKQKDLEGTYYASLIKRIHCLEKAGYITQTKTNEAQGSKAASYELCPKAYLAAFLNYHSPEFLLSKVTDKDARIILSDLIQVISPT
jgi:hypothetical protein